MGPATASLLPLKRYAEFGGRSTRTELISFYVLVTLVTAAFRFGAGAIDPRLGWGLSVILSLVLLCPVAALFVRRFHDVGWSGWWLLPAIPGTALGLWENFNRIADPSFPRLVVPTAVQVASALYAVAVIAVLLWDDRAEPNRYGPNPRSVEIGAPA